MLADAWEQLGKRTTPRHCKACEVAQKVLHLSLMQLTIDLAHIKHKHEGKVIFIQTLAPLKTRIGRCAASCFQHKKLSE